MTALLFVASAGCVDLGVPQWSPDGRRIVYTRFGSEDTEIRLVDLDRSEPPKLVASGALSPRWSPDGGRVYFLSRNGVLRACAPGRADNAVDPTAPDGSGTRTVASGVSWYEPSPKAEVVYCARERDGTVQKLALAGGRTERVTPEGVKCAGAALGPGGDLLAYATQKEERDRTGYEIRLVDLEGGGRERALKGLVPVAGEKGKDGGLRMLFRPQAAELVVFQHHGAERVHVVPLARGRARSIKVGKLGWVVMSGISPEGAYLYLTETALTYPEQGGAATSRLVDLDTGETEVLAGDSRVLVGGLGWAPGGGAVAEHSAAGLVVREVQGAWDRYYPVSTDEYAAAARIRIRERRPREALDILQEALDGREAGIDRQRLGLAAVDALLLLGDRKAAAEALLEAWLLHPVSEAGDAEAMRLFGALRGDDRLAEAVYRALRKKARARVKVFKEAVSLTGDTRFLAGLRFRLGEAEFAAKNYTEAGKSFRLASEADGFPAADYAAGLSAGAHFVSGTNDTYAEELFLKAIDCFPDSPLAGDFRTALWFVRRNKGALVRRAAEASHESGATAWVAARSVRSMRWSFGRRESQSRLTLDADERWALHVAGPDSPPGTVLDGTDREISTLRFSPSGERLAFLVKGDLVEPFVVDLNGKIILGDPPSSGDGPKATSGVRIPLHSVTRFQWSKTGDALVLSGIEKTAGGGARRQERRIRVPR